MAANANLVFAWTWILAGFVSGMLMGLRFHEENWLGGYSSFKRRMYRLGHISFFGLGAVNLMFHFTVRGFSLGTLGTVASIAFIVGGVSMPLCCWVIAQRKAQSKTVQSLFAIPVISLMAGAILTILVIL